MFALLSLAACGGGAAVSSNQAVGAPSYIDLSPVAPPPLSSETQIGLTDPRTQLWRPGHWIYQNQEFVWQPGEVLTKPSPTAVWSPDHWEHREYGWVFMSGYWQ